MDSKIYIDELKQEVFLDIKKIQKWLVEHEYITNYFVSETSCRKWDKWKNNNEEPFPCVCSVRNDECIFIELFYNLKGLEGAYLETEELKQRIEKFNDSESIKKYNESLLKLEQFQTIKIVTSNEPYQTIKLKIDLNLKNI